MDEKDPMNAAIKLKHKKMFDSFLFVHDHLEPLEVFEALQFML
jgi:hypothetical protein